MPNFPTTLDAWEDISCPSSVDPKTRVNDIANALELVEAKVGIDSSAVTTSHDYKLSGVMGSDKAVSLTGTETLTNKRLNSPKINEAVDLTATATELNILDGATLSTSELNILDGVTASATEINKLVGITSTAVGISDTQTLTNKTLTSAKINTEFLNTGGTQIYNVAEGVWRKNVLVRAYLGSNQSLTANVTAKVLFDTETFDVGSDFNTTTSVFTAPIAGYYRVYTNLRFSVGADLDGIDIFVTLSGIGALGGGRSQFRASGTSSQHGQVADLVFLPSAGTLQIDARNISNNDTIESGASLSYVTIALESL